MTCLWIVCWFRIESIFLFVKQSTKYFCVQGASKPKTYYIAHEILSTEQTFVDALKLVFEVSWGNCFYRGKMPVLCHEACKSINK